MACDALAKGVQCKTAEKSKNKGMVHMFYSTFLTTSIFTHPPIQGKLTHRTCYFGHMKPKQTL